MTKILTSVFAIAAVATVTGVGSWALWSDSETSEGNYVQAGYMDLTVDPSTITVSNVYPGQTGFSDTITVKNDSNAVSGMLSVAFDSLVNYENWCVEPEINEGADPTCSLIADPANLPTVLADFVGAGRGELGDHVKITSISVDGTSIPVGLTINGFAGAGPLALPTPLTAGQSVDVIVNWEVDDNTAPADNIFMTDAVVVDATFTLEQI